MSEDKSARADAAAVKPAEIPALTGIRLVAALSIAVGHGTHMLFRFDGPPSEALVQLLNAIGFGMTTFFVLSGFVIHYNYAQYVASGWRHVVDFLWARLSRLYPLFLFVLIADVVFGRKLVTLMLGRADEFTEVAQAVPYYLVFMQSWVYRAFGSNSLIYVVGVDAPLTWSISTEWFFYLCYPAIAAVVLTINRRAWGILAVILWCLGWSIFLNWSTGYANEIDRWASASYGRLAAIGQGGNQDSFYRWLFYFSPYIRIGEFILGALVAQLYIRLQPHRVGERERRFGVIALWLGLASLPVVAHLIYSPTGSWAFLQRMNMNFALGPSVAVIIFCAARYPSWLSRALGSRMAVTFGDASYSIYLLHFLVFAVISGYVGQPVEPSWTNIALVVIRYVFAVMVLLCLSLGTYRAIERPCLQWLRSLSRRTRIVLLFVPIATAAVIYLITLGTGRTEGLSIVSATYGENCKAQISNVTTPLRRACDGRNHCSYIVDVSVLGDPGPGCGKNFAVEYRCNSIPTIIKGELPGEAHGKEIVLDCSANR